jgi:hypothetical protein
MGSGLVRVFISLVIFLGMTLGWYVSWKTSPGPHPGLREALTFNLGFALAAAGVDLVFTGWVSLWGRIRSGFARLWRLVRGRQRTRTLRQEFRRFFGPDYDKRETHDKQYPGYDLASLHRALASLHEDCCDEFRHLGAVGGYGEPTLRRLFDRLKSVAERNLKPIPPTYQRVPVDVDQEASFATNALWLATLHSGEAGPEKIAIFLAAVESRYESYDGMDTQQAPRLLLSVSIACRCRAVADQFFAAVEERRRRLSIYRGKVIEPAVSAGGIRTIGLRAIEKVGEHDLILPTKVRELIHSSILGFYEHRDLLEELGIELKRGILFHSPPGTGKTSISLYLAGRLPHFTVCFVSGGRLLYPREICQMARYLQPAMVIFEDIDLVAQDRNATGLATVLGELMNQIDGCEPDEQVLFVMNTNSVERLEHAVRNRPGRVDQIIDIPLPGPEERRQLIAHFARGLRLDVADMAKVLEATEGATPAMLKEIVKRAAVGAIGRAAPTGKGVGLALTEADLVLATLQVRELRQPEAVPGALGFRRERDGGPAQAAGG